MSPALQRNPLLAKLDAAPESLTRDELLRLVSELLLVLGAQERELERQRQQLRTRGVYA